MPIRPPGPPSSPPNPSTPPVAPAKPNAPVDVIRSRDDVFDTTASAESPLTTVFTPGDAALKVELAALDEVISARRADSRTFPAGENPYRIEYAVYNLNEPAIIERLTEAARLGVRVQILIDQDQVLPHVWWNTLREELTAAGFSFSQTQKGLTPEQLDSTQLIGMDLPGTFHLKTRYFSYPNAETGAIEEKLLTGSYNPTKTSRDNDESLHAIEDGRVIAKYRSAIAAMRNGEPVVNAWENDAALNVLFTAPGSQGPRAIDKIFEWVDAEKEAILISVFSLRNLKGPDKAKLVDRLAAARERGVHVAVITDRKQSDGVDASGEAEKGASNDRTDELLQAAGIPTYEALNNTEGPYQAMHLKAAVFGLSDIKVVTDAGNWSWYALGDSGSNYSKNAESLLFVDSSALDANETGRRYLSEFLHVLRKYAPQNPDQPDAETLIASMQQHPSWPKVKVSFDVLARTYFGQDVYVRGSSPELGGWRGPGLKLDTEAGTYPHWKTDALELPLGMRLEYKVVKQDGGRVDWEPGENAVIIVDPSADAEADEKHVIDAFG